VSIRIIFMLLGLIGGYTQAFAGTDKTRVLVNAKIYTVDTRRSWAQAMAINPAGVIVGVGTRAEVLAGTGDNIDIVDLEGRMILPGFQDVHLHALEAGVNASMCEFGADETLPDYQWLLRQCIRQNKTSAWIVGSGVNIARLLEKSANPVSVLDAVTKDRPVLILDDLGHGAWANSVALKMVGYDRLQANPAGGTVLRNAKTGKPNGVVLENAQQKLRNAAFPPSDANLSKAYKGLMKTQKILAANGITSISDAGGFWLQGHDQVWVRAAERNELTVRASNALYVYPDLPFDRQVRQLIQRFSNNKDSLLRFNQVKIYVDGILSQATAALYEPYAGRLGLDKGKDTGFLYFAPELLDKYTRTLTAAGFQLHFHVTGDRATGLALDAIAVAAKGTGPHRISHLYMIDKRDRPRFKKLNVVADFQIPKSATDNAYLTYMQSLIGARANQLLPIGSLLAEGSNITLSSDWDADELSPLKKLVSVLTRRRQNVPDLATAIEMMTINPARLMRQEDTTGSIEVGKYADIVILDRNLFDMRPEQIGKAKVQATLLQGEAVFDAAGLFQ